MYLSEHSSLAPHHYSSPPISFYALPQLPLPPHPPPFLRNCCDRPSVPSPRHLCASSGHARVWCVRVAISCNTSLQHYCNAPETCVNISCVVTDSDVPCILYYEFVK